MKALLHNLVSCIHVPVVHAEEWLWSNATTSDIICLLIIVTVSLCGCASGRSAVPTRHIGTEKGHVRNVDFSQTPEIRELADYARRIGNEMYPKILALLADDSSKSGYCCAGAFLMFVDATYGPHVVRQLNAELRRDSYSDSFFAKATGKSVDALWAEFQKTPAFTSVAAETLQLQAELGYVNGQPPKDIGRRLTVYLEEYPVP